MRLRHYSSPTQVVVSSGACGAAPASPPAADEGPGSPSMAALIHSAGPMSVTDTAAQGEAGSVRSGEAARVLPLLGRKSVLLGMLTSGFVLTNAAPAFAAGTTKPTAIVAAQPAYVTKWAPSTAYVLGAQVISPRNDVISASVAHTSSSAYAPDTAKWVLSSTYEEGTTSVVYVAEGGSDAQDGKTRGKPKLTVLGALAALAGTPGVIEVGAGTITETVTWGTIPANMTIRGAGKAVTTIRHAFNGDMCSRLGDGVKLQDFTIDGQGATYSGRGFYISNADGNQQLTDIGLSAWDGYCIEFAYDSGSRFAAIGLTAARTSAGSGTGRYAIKISDTQQLSAVPRSFVNLQTGGQCAIDFGGCNDTFLVSSFVADLRFTPDTRGVNISSTRIANQQSLTVDGHNNSLVGCDFNPQVTIAPGADKITIGPASFNAALPVIDSSGNDRNMVTHQSLAYTPTFRSGGTAPSLGNGTLTGTWSRSGTQITATVNFTVGSTTTLGTGGLYFGLPVARINGDVVYPGTAVINAASTQYVAAVQIPGNVAYATLIRDTSGSVTHNSPATLAAGNTIRFTITYMP
jgi:hypothetical protein